MSMPTGTTSRLLLSLCSVVNAYSGELRDTLDTIREVLQNETPRNVLALSHPPSRVGHRDAALSSVPAAIAAVSARKTVWPRLTECDAATTSPGDHPPSGPMATE